jgi:hypothetical protein
MIHDLTGDIVSPGITERISMLGDFSVTLEGYFEPGPTLVMASYPQGYCWMESEGTACDRVKGHLGRHSWEYDHEG